MKLGDILLLSGVAVGIVDALQLGLDIPTDLLAGALVSGGFILKTVE